MKDELINFALSLDVDGISKIFNRFNRESSGAKFIFKSFFKEEFVKKEQLNLLTSFIEMKCFLESMYTKNSTTTLESHAIKRKLDALNDAFCQKVAPKLLKSVKDQYNEHRGLTDGEAVMNKVLNSVYKSKECKGLNQSDLTIQEKVNILNKCFDNTVDKIKPCLSKVKFNDQIFENRSITKDRPQTKNDTSMYHL